MLFSSAYLGRGLLKDFTRYLLKGSDEEKINQRPALHSPEIF
jgi:hypothetical protein